MKKTQFISFLFSFIVSLCCTVTVSGQIQLSDIDAYSWKEKSDALESLAALQSQQSITEDVAIAAFSTQTQDRINFAQIVYKNVYQKIISNIDVQTSILDGFNETVDALSSPSSVEASVQQKALEILIDTLKQ